MKKSREVIIQKYPKGKCPNDGEVLWARIFLIDDFNKKEKAINRLFRMIEEGDKDRLKYVMNDTVSITRVPEDGAFNDKGEVVFSKHTITNKEFTNNAAKRLARYLTSKKDGYVYFGGFEWVSEGKNAYIMGTRDSEILSFKDKMVYIRRKLGGRKGALTRSLIKLRKIREEYKHTLFPEGYKEDKKFKQLMKYLPNQKARVWEAKRMTALDVAPTTGSIEHKSIPYLKMILKTLGE